jgi:hypothetical protein
VNFKGLRPRFVVIPTNGRACLKDCLMAIAPQVDSTIVVYTVPWKDGEVRPHPNSGVALRDTGPPNISRWWNLGLEVCAQVMSLNEGDTPGRYDVAILNDDVIVPPGWFEAVSDGMREHAGAAGCSGGSGIVVHRAPGPVPLHTRLQGFAFILAGEKNIRANEEMRWYFSDDYVDWKAREAGGMVMIPGYSVNHLHPNEQMTGELHQFSAEDAAKFKEIWGIMPW